MDDPDVGAQRAGGRDRVVDGVPVDDDDLVQAGRQFGEESFDTYLETKVIGIRSPVRAKSLAWGES